MPFRGHDGEDPEYLRDSLQRFMAIDEALESSRRMLGDSMPQRFAAINAILMPGSPAELASSMRAYAERLRGYTSLTMAFLPAMDVLFASVLLRYGDTPEALMSEVERVRPLMRRRRLRWSPVYEFIAILALRVVGRGAPIEERELDRMRAIYEAMRSHHWFLTGADDFPMCALLATREGEPAELAGHANAIYEALREDAGAFRGEILQTASNALALSPLGPRELSARFAALRKGFDAKGLRMGQDTYDELAVLCYIARPLDAIVECVTGFEREIRANVRWFERLASFNWAANLAFMRFVGGEPELGPLADIKALLDMQWILTQRG